MAWWRDSAPGRPTPADLGGTHVARALEARVRGDARRMGVLVTRHLALAVTLALLVRPPLAAQLPAADQAFQRGDYAAARASYERVLAADSSNERALYRLAILDSWDGKLIRSLARFARLRRIDPHDPDIMVTQAQVLAWAGRTAASEALYDSVLERFPDRADALAGRARARAHNVFGAREATVPASLGSDLRGTLRAGWRYATLSDAAGNVITSGTSYGGGAYGIAALGKGAVLRAGLGARRVEPDGGRARTPLTAQLGLGLRPGRYTAVSLGYSRTPFDETAGLMQQDLTVDAVDLSFDISPGPGWSLSGGGGGAWFSDQNNRYSAVGALLGRVMKGLQIGPFARVMGYRQPRPGLYFTPVRFSVIEGRAVYQWQRNGWGLRTDGGVGSQQVQAFGTLPAPHQTEWHVGVSLSRGWGANNEVALVGSITNSAAAATVGVVTGSFRYRTLGLRFRQGL